MLSVAFSALALAGAALAIPLNGVNITFEKRDYTDARFTWFDAGLGACGIYNTDSDFIVALNEPQWSTSYCFDYVTLEYNGKTATAQITDMCPGCPWGGLDLTPAVYDALTYPGAHGSDSAPGGPIYGTWDFGSSGSSGGSPSSGGNTIHPNGDTSKCLDVEGANYANGTPVDIYDCNGTGAQNWVINAGQTAVQVAGTNYCLDAGSTPGDGTQMKIWECYSGLAAQTWYYTSDNRISLMNQGYCLDLTSGSEGDGNVMQIWECTTGDTNQIWTLS